MNILQYGALYLVLTFCIWVAEQTKVKNIFVKSLIVFILDILITWAMIALAWLPKVA